MSIPFLLDEKLTVVPVSSAGERSGGAREEPPSSRFSRAKAYVDCNSFGPREIEAAVRLYGVERIVCGTDRTEFGCEWTSKALAEAEIDEDARAKP